MTLALSADRTVYYVGEAVHLTPTLRNTSGTPLMGNFFLEATCSFVEIRYRKIPSPFSTFSPPVSRSVSNIAGLEPHVPDDDVITPKTLKPDDEVSTETVIVWDAAAGRFVLSTPGEYEFQVIYRDTPRDPNGLLTSSVVAVHVASPDRFEEAFDAYSRGGLALLVQRGAGVSVDAQMVVRARSFIERYPDSPYAAPVREALTEALRMKIARNKASKGEEELYANLKKREPRHDPGMDADDIEDHQDRDGDHERR
jgi:hypothetical protein